MLRLSRDDIEALVLRGLITRGEVQAGVLEPLRPGRAKGGRRADLGDRYFRSSWEANRVRFLNWRIARGEVLAWIYEPVVFRFPVERGCREYRPDFRVDLPDGQTRYEEVKGYMDQKSKTRLTRMARYYPGVRVDLITGTWFREMEASGFAAVLPGWEWSR